MHSSCLHSVSQKFPLYADRADQLQQRGVGRRAALMVVATQTTVLLKGEWLEAFWCDQCQQTQWYHVRRVENARYEVSLAPAELWQHAIGVVNPQGNPSVSEFTREQARMGRYSKIKDYQFVI
jgi:hypothetical protein